MTEVAQAERLPVILQNARAAFPLGSAPSARSSARSPGCGTSNRRDNPPRKASLRSSARWVTVSTGSSAASVASTSSTTGPRRLGTIPSPRSWTASSRRTTCTERPARMPRNSFWRPWARCSRERSSTTWSSTRRFFADGADRLHASADRQPLAGHGRPRGPRPAPRRGSRAMKLPVRLRLPTVPLPQVGLPSDEEGAMFGRPVDVPMHSVVRTELPTQIRSATPPPR